MQSGETDHADLLAPWKRRAFWIQAELRWAEQSLETAATGLAGADQGFGGGGGGGSTERQLGADRGGRAGERAGLGRARAHTP